VREDLVGKSQRGDGQAFRELVGPMQTALYNLALRILGDREEARDVVQETLTTGWLSLPQLRRRDTFQSTTIETGIVALGTAAPVLLLLGGGIVLFIARRPRRAEGSF